MIELDKIYNMDCLQGLKRIDDKSLERIEKVRKKIKAEQAQLTLF